METVEKVILVDEQDNVLGEEEKQQAHIDGKLHRAFSVFVFRENENQELELLLQQRAKTKYHCGGLWTNTCCSHPRINENIVAAGKRRLQEELGFSCDLTKINSFCYRAELANGLIEHEYDHVLIGKVAFDILVTPNPEEVCAYKWIKLTEVAQLFADNRDKFTPWFNLALASLQEKVNFAIDIKELL